MSLPCCFTSCPHQPVWCSGEAPPPYGHGEPQPPLQAFTTLESNWAECVRINYPIIQLRHAIKGAAAITRCRHRLSHVAVTQRGRRLPFLYPAEGGVDTPKGRARTTCTLPDRNTPPPPHKWLIRRWWCRDFPMFLLSKNTRGWYELVFKLICSLFNPELVLLMEDVKTSSENRLSHL